MAGDKRTWAETLASYARSVADEAIMPAAQKLIPQGAAELAQALYTGSGYMPYGPTEKPVPMEAMDQGGVHGPEMGQDQPQQAMQDLGTVHGSYQATLDAYAAQGRDAQEREIERGR